MTITPLLLVLVLGGMALAWFAGTAVARRNIPLAFVLAWLALCTMLVFMFYR